MRWVTPAATLACGTVLLAGQARQPRLPFAIVETGQSACYDNRRAIDPPKRGSAFYGQDAQSRGNQPSYSLSADGLTVYDNVTGLTWQRSPDTNRDGALTRADKLTLAQAREWPAKLNAAGFGGFRDWRLPTIKELYSLILFSGVDPSGPAMDAGGQTPFIDTKFFRFAYGDPAAGERVIDSQYASSTVYVGKSFKGVDKLFGVNFADGRIKGYDLLMPGGAEKTFFVQCVRGNPLYGANDFRDNGDGTITDRASGLEWAKADSGKGMNWEAALAFVQSKNAEKYMGRGDWRLPSAKELQSIVDYTRSPDTSGSAAINPLFICTPITNEVGKADYAFYWTSTTHASLNAGANAVYIAFGRAAGWPSGIPGGGGAGRGAPGRGAPGRGGPPPGEPARGGQPPDAGAGQRQFVDVHGAGSQRSDPKAGDPTAFPYGRGPQGDVIRINNFVRLVRGGLNTVTP
jgi:hypothetical protein